MRHLAWLTLSLISLSACTVGPDFQRPDASRVGQWSEPQGRQAASRAVSDPLQERWWDVFHDEQLSALTRRALNDNLDLKLASSRLQQSRAIRQVTTAERYPNVDAGGAYQRKRNSGKGLNDPSGENGRSAFNQWDMGFSASWELDFWGRVKRETEAADATLEVAENDRRAVLLSVLAETAQDYIQLRGVQNTRAVTEQNLDVARHSLKLSQLRLADGVATDLDVAEAAAQVAAIEARLPDLQQRQDQLINALSLLMGEPPRTRSCPKTLPCRKPNARSRSACHRNSPSVAPTSARPKRACTLPLPASAWPRVTSTRASPCLAAWGPKPCSSRISVLGVPAPLPSAHS